MRDKSTLVIVVALVVTMASTAAAQEGPLHRPPFLEPTTLFWTVRPNLSRGGLDLSDVATALDADIFPHFVLGGARRCSKDSAADIHGAAPCVSFTPAIRIRMENRESVPIESPSFMPRLNMQWLFYGRDHTVNLGLYLGHHSNGQAGCLFEWTDGQGCARDGSFSPGDLESGSVRPDTDDGNFSLNYTAIALDFARYTTDNSEARRVAGYRLSLSAERAPDNWKFSSMRNGIYPTWKVRVMGGLAIANAPLCARADVFAQVSGYEYNDEMTRSLWTQFTCLWSEKRGLGVFLRYSRGRDDYNSYFFIRDPQPQRLQFGFTINHLRMFGGHY